MKLDMNCDVGESFGAWNMGADADVLPHVSSANIACGMHAGDPTTIMRTVELCARLGIAVGAHPGYPDLQGFGRRAMAMTPDQIYDSMVYQIGAVKAAATTKNLRLQHVKAHGALYNQAAQNSVLADAICAAIHDVDAQLLVYGLAGSHWVSSAEKAGLTLVQEVFADRSYQDNGTLTPRTQPGAMIEDVEHAIKQVISMVKDGMVQSLSGKWVPVQAQTLCIHGDQPGAATFAKAIHNALNQVGVHVCAPSAT